MGVDWPSQHNGHLLYSIMEDNQQHAQSKSETEFMVPNLSLCDPLLEHFEQSCLWPDVSQVPSILAAVDCCTVGVKIVIWGH